MLNHLVPLIARPINRHIATRCLSYKFTRVKTPPLQEPKESPYIVGPYLKPDYKQVEYLTEPIKFKEINDFDHMFYEYEEIPTDEERQVKLLLIDDVEGLGVAGQLVEVNYRLGASKLIAMRKAEYVSDFALKHYKFGPRSEQSPSTALSPRTVRLLKKREFLLPVGKQAKIEPWHLSLSLRLAGFYCSPKNIDANSIETKLENNEVFVKCVVIVNNHERVDVKFVFPSLDDVVEDSSDDMMR